MRPAGHPHHQAQPVAHVLLHEALEHRGSGRGDLSGAPTTYLGHHVSLLRTGYFVSVGEISAGRWDVCLHVHAGADVCGQMFGHLPAPPLSAPEERPFLRAILLGAEPGLQRPADVHFLPERSGIGGVRLLGRLREALGSQSLHHMDQPLDLHHPRGHSERLLRADQLQDMAKLQAENEARAVREHGAPDLQRQHAGAGEQRQAHLQGEDNHRENDFCHRGGVYHLLDPVFLGPDVVCVGSRRAP